jgi:Flp pilus assembly protein TadG
VKKAVEFALVATAFFTLLFGCIELGRVLWLWNAASEATRLGARLAVVCDIGDADIATRMQNSLGLSDARLVAPTITYAPAGCTRDTCRSVTVTLNAAAVQTTIPFVDFSPVLPPFSTTLSRESLSSTDNAVCQP